MIRAAGLAAGTGLAAGGVDGGGFWEAKTGTALQSLLHAAALDHCPPAELFRWTLDPAAAHDAVSILLSTPAAATGWGDALRAMLEADPRTRDSIWRGVSLSLGAFADPRVLDPVSPPEGEEFDPAGSCAAMAPFTCSQLARGRTTRPHSCRRLSRTSWRPGAASRLEARGCTTRPAAARPRRVRQPGATLLASHAHGGRRRHRYYDHAGAAIPRPGTHELERQRGRNHLGLLDRQDRDRRNRSNSSDLHDLSTLIGDRDDSINSTTIGDRGSRSSQRSIRCARRPAQYQPLPHHERAAGPPLPVGC